MTLLPGVGPEIEPGMIAVVATTVFVTGAMKGVVGFGLSTGSVVVFSLLYPDFRNSTLILMNFGAEAHAILCFC